MGRGGTGARIVPVLEAARVTANAPQRTLRTSWTRLRRALDPLPRPAALLTTDASLTPWIAAWRSGLVDGPGALGTRRARLVMAGADGPEPAGVCVWCRRGSAVAAGTPAHARGGFRAHFGDRNLASRRLRTVRADGSVVDGVSALATSGQISVRVSDSVGLRGCDFLQRVPGADVDERACPTAKWRPRWPERHPTRAMGI